MEAWQDLKEAVGQAQELKPDKATALLSLSPGLEEPRSHDHVTENVPEAPEPLKRNPAIGPS